MSIFATDLLRILSVTFIIFNHVSWPFFARSGTASEMPLDSLVALMNQLGKPSVLIFIFLSGLAFARHRINAEFKALKFYKNRAGRILPPYLLASFLGVYFFNTVTPENLPAAFFTGAAMYHLYFVALISYCYLLFPLMREIKPSKLNILLLAGSFLSIHFILALFFPETTNPAFSKFLRDTFAVNYELQIDKTIVLWIEFLSFALLFFQSGIWIGRNTDKAPERSALFFTAAVSVMIAAYFAVFADFNFRLGEQVHADTSGRTWRMSVLFYAVTWIFLLRNMNVKQSPPLMRRLARASFLVYLFHPFLINITKPMGYTSPVLHTVLIIISSWTLSILLQHLALKYHLAGLLLGEGDKIIEKKSKPAIILPQQA